MLTRRESRAQVAEAGFTTLELFIVIAIIGLVAAIALVNMFSSGPQRRTKAALTELHSGLNLSRMAAMGRNASATVTLATVGSTVQVTFMDSLGSRVREAQTMPGDVTAFTGGPITFNSLGMKTSGGTANQLITLTNVQGTTYSIVVTPQGKVNWCLKATCP